MGLFDLVVQAEMEETTVGREGGRERGLTLRRSRMKGTRA